MQKDIVHIWSFKQPPEQVWPYLTESDLISQWLMKNDFKPVTGHRFTFQAGPVAALDFDGIVHCEVLEIKPKEKLSYSWKYGSGKGSFHIDSTVTWTLKPTATGTELKLVHAGIDNVKYPVDFQAMYSGWKSNVDKIEKMLTT